MFIDVLKVFVWILFMGSLYQYITYLRRWAIDRFLRRLPSNEKLWKSVLYLLLSICFFRLLLLFY